MDRSSARERRPLRAPLNPYQPPSHERDTLSEAHERAAPTTRLLLAHGFSTTLLWGALSARGFQRRHIVSTLAAFGYVVLSTSRFSLPSAPPTWRVRYASAVGAGALGLGMIFGPSEASALHACTAVAVLLAIYGTPGRVRYWTGAAIVAFLDILLLVGVLRRLQ